MNPMCQQGFAWYLEPDLNVVECSNGSDLTARTLNNHIYSGIRGFDFGSLTRFSKLPSLLNFAYTPQIKIIFRNNKFNLIIYLTRKKSIICRNIPIKFLSLANDIRSRYHIPCSNRTENEHDYPSSEALYEYHRTIGKRNSCYVKCVANNVGLISAEGNIYECPNNKPFFDGYKCTQELSCANLPNGYKWRTEDMEEQEYVICMNGIAVRLVCPRGMYFDGVECTAIDLDGCAGLVDGTKVKCGNDGYRVCTNGKSSEFVFSCPPWKSSFISGDCVSPLCVDGDTRLSGDLNLSASFSCVDGEAVFHKVRKPNIKSVFANYISFLKNLNIKNFHILHWFLLWPPWLNSQTTLEDAIIQNDNSLTLYRLKCLPFSPFSYAVIKLSENKYSLTTSSKTNYLLPYAANPNKSVPFAPILTATVNIPFRNLALLESQPKSYLFGDKNVLFSVCSDKVSLIRQCSENELIVSADKTVYVGESIENNPYIYSCAERAWSSYFPVHTESKKNLLSIGNVSCVYIFEHTSFVPRSSSRKLHGIRTYAYVDIQTHAIRSEKAITLITLTRKGNSHERKRETISFPFHNFLNIPVKSYVSRNGFMFRGLQFASLHTAHAAYIYNREGTGIYEITCIENGELQETIFAGYNFNVSHTEDNNLFLRSATGCVIKVTPIPPSLSISVFGFETILNQQDNNIFIPVGFEILSHLQENVSYSLPHIPLRIMISSLNKEIGLSYEPCLSSDKTTYEIHECVSLGSFWDYERDDCFDEKRSEALPLMTDEILKHLFSFSK